MTRAPLAPYCQDETVTLYHGRFEDVLPELGVAADLILADPPYAETSLPWDVWPRGWPSTLAGNSRSMWCFGSMRMFLDRRDEFTDWRLSQDVVWEKHNGSGIAADRFRRVHEHALHWYRGNWASVYHEPQTIGDERRPQRINRGATPHLGADGQQSKIAGRRIASSVLFARSMHGIAINETEKPIGIIEPLIAYGCPPDGLVLDPFAGSCSTLFAARAIGRRAIGIEMREEQCELAARRLAQGCLNLEDTS